MIVSGSGIRVFGGWGSGCGKHEISGVICLGGRVFCCGCRSWMVC